MESKEMRIIFLYEFKLGHSASEATRNINSAFGEDSVSDRTIRRWFEKFRSGDTSLDNLPRGHAPSVVDDDTLKSMVEANPRLTIRDIADNIAIHYSTVSRHLKAMGKVKKLDKWVPHELTETDKIRRMEISSSLLSRHNNEGILNRIVTCDEKWILYDNRRRSAQWLDADQAPKHMPKPSLHPRKIMVSVWWSAKGVVHFSFLKQGETINADKYCQEIDAVMEKMRKEQPALLTRRGMLLLHDNARPHVAKQTVKKLTELKCEILPHPPYSPDLSPTDYHFFKHLDSFLREKIFKTTSDVENAFNDFLASRSSDFYEKGINALVSRWKKCIEVNGDYFD